MLDGHVYWDAARALEQLGGDEGLFREIVQIFLHEAPKHLAGLRQALAQRDKDSVERIAHTLKGELSYLGVSAAAHHASKLEDAGRNGDLEHESCFARKDLQPISDPAIWSSFQWLRRQFRSNLKSTSLHQPCASW